MKRTSACWWTISLIWEEQNLIVCSPAARIPAVTTRQCDQRLTPLGVEMGVVGPARRRFYEQKMHELAALKKDFAGNCIMPGSELDQKLSLDLRKETTLLDALRRPRLPSKPSQARWA